MSAVGGSADIGAVIKQMIDATILGMDISSSAGDSPKINRVLTLPEVPDFGSIIDNAIRNVVAEQQQGTQDIAATDAATGITEGQAVGLAGTALSKIQNPTTLVADALSFLPHTALVAFAISLIPILINELTKPGGPWDLRFKRIVEKEVNSLMSRQNQYDYAIGERGLIIQSRAGFLNRHTGGVNSNTLRQIREGGIDKNLLTQIDYTDHSKGLF